MEYPPVSQIVETVDRHRRHVCGPVTLWLPENDKAFAPILPHYLNEVGVVCAWLQRHAPDRCAAWPGQIFLDVGGACGVSTIAALFTGLFHAAVTCEPSPRNAELLRRNLVLNPSPSGAQAIVVEAAVDDVSRPAADFLQSYTGNIGACELATIGNAAYRGKRQVVLVRTVTVTEALAEALCTPADLGLVWCDTQGSDMAVLRSLVEALPGAVLPPCCVELAPELWWQHGERPEHLPSLAQSRYKWFVDTRKMTVEAAQPIEKLSELVHWYSTTRRTNGQLPHTNVLLWN